MRPIGVESKKDMGARNMQRIILKKYCCAVLSPTYSTINERIIIKKVLPNASPTYTDMKFNRLEIFLPCFGEEAQAIQ